MCTQRESMKGVLQKTQDLILFSFSQWIFDSHIESNGFNPRKKSSVTPNLTFPNYTNVSQNEIFVHRENRWKCLLHDTKSTFTQRFSQWNLGAKEKQLFATQWSLNAWFVLQPVSIIYRNSSAVDTYVVNFTVWNCIQWQGN